LLQARENLEWMCRSAWNMPPSLSYAAGRELPQPDPVMCRLLLTGDRAVWAGASQWLNGGAGHAAV
jgi:hypothetical protein